GAWEVNARMSAYREIVSFSLSRSRMVVGVSRCSLSDRVPRSGLASTASTRSPRSDARVEPRAAVVVVLPTPPLRESTATRWCPPTTWVHARLISSWRRRPARDSPGVTRPKVSDRTARRHPEAGPVRWPPLHSRPGVTTGGATPPGGVTARLAGGCGGEAGGGGGDAGAARWGTGSAGRGSGRSSARTEGCGPLGPAGHAGADGSGPGD